MSYPPRRLSNHSLVIVFSLISVIPVNTEAVSKVFDGMYTGMSLGLNIMTGDVKSMPPTNSGNNALTPFGKSGFNNISPNFGLLFGYRWAIDEALLGFEFSCSLNNNRLNYSTTQGTNSIPGLPQVNNLNNIQNNNFQIQRQLGMGLSTIVGMFLNHHVVAFLKLGIEDGQFRTGSGSQSQQQTTTVNFRNNSTNFQYKLGLGLESQLADSLSIRCEFDYIVAAKSLSVSSQNSNPQNSFVTRTRPTSYGFHIIVIYSLS